MQVKATAQSKQVTSRMKGFNPRGATCVMLPSSMVVLNSASMMSSNRSSKASRSVFGPEAQPRLLLSYGNTYGPPCLFRQARQFMSNIMAATVLHALFTEPNLFFRLHRLQKPVLSAGKKPPTLLKLVNNNVFQPFALLLAVGSAKPVLNG